MPAVPCCPCNVLLPDAEPFLGILVGGPSSTVLSPAMEMVPLPIW